MVNKQNPVLEVLSAKLEHYYSQHYRWVTELLADKIGERTKFNFVQ